MLKEIWNSVTTDEERIIERKYGPFNSIQLSYELDNETPAAIYTLTLDNN